MSGWRIVPVEMTPEMFEADVRCACDAQAERMLGSGATFADAMHACYRAQLAAAPEPDWNALVDVVFTAVMPRGELMRDHIGRSPYYTDRECMIAALKAAFGSKP